MTYSGSEQLRYGYTHPGVLNRVVSTWKSGNKLYARLQNNNVASMSLTYTNLVWSKEPGTQQYVDYQSFAASGSFNPSPYYTGDDYTPPTGVTVNPPIAFTGGGNQFDWITTFGNVSSLTKTYSGSLTFGTGSCIVNLNWYSMGLEATDALHASAQATPGSGAKGLSRPVQEQGDAPAWLPGIQGALEQAGAQVTAWLFRTSGSGPRTTSGGGQVQATPNPGHIWRSYYYAGGSRVAVRVQDRPDPSHDGLFYLLGDHLGSTSITTDEEGNQIAEMRYSAWGEVRYSSGGTPTKYTYTGQYSYTDDFGLMFYGARWKAYG